jgi:hypothetical protein
MFSALTSAWFGSRTTKRPRPARSRLTLQSLERRDTPSGGGHNTLPQHSTDVVGAPETSKVAHVASELATGDRQNGYPLPPAGGPIRTTTGTITAPPTAVLVPMGDGGPTVVVGPVVTV